MQQYQHYRPLNNLVLVKSIYDRESTTGLVRKMQSGILAPTAHNPGQHAVTELKVIAAPDCITWHDTPPEFIPDCFMDWQPEMEIRPDDIAIVLYGSISWVNYDEEHKGRMQGRRMIDGEDVYYWIPYSAIYCIIRDGQIIPVNGYVLIEPIKNEEKETPLITEVSQDEVNALAHNEADIAAYRHVLETLGWSETQIRDFFDYHFERILSESQGKQYRKVFSETEGTVRYISKPLLHYRNQEDNKSLLPEHHIDIQVGDHVQFPRGKSIDIQHPFYMLAEFQGKTLYRMQRKDIVSVERI